MTDPEQVPSTPPALRARGRAYWQHAVATYELSASEIELLRECCRTLDEIEQLRRAIANDGLTVDGSSGQPRVHPAVSAVRMHRLALGRLLGQLALPGADDETLTTGTQARSRRGTASRWGGAHRGSAS